MSRIDYRPRIADGELAARLRSAGAVLIEGAKACGKTETARQQAASEVLLDIDDNARAAARVDPALILEGATPRLIDEWHLEPRIWNHVRRAVDDRRRRGQFILAGSAAPADDLTRHTGTRRIQRLRMRPMSLFEADVSTGSISLATLLDGDQATSPDPGLTVQDLADEIARGGWPAERDLELTDVLRANRAYLDEVRRTDIQAVDGVRRDPKKVERVMRSLAHNVATSVALTTLAADAGGAHGPIDDETVAAYLHALERLFVIEDQPAWAPHLRSKYNLRRASRRHFVDPSLAVAALRTSPRPLLDDLNLLGLMFESLVVRDLRIYAQPLDGEVLQYRDQTGLEVDAVVSTPDGRWAAFEVELGGALIDEGAESLRKFVNRVDTAKCGEPAALGVIAGVGYGYVRPDGIQVIPIGALGP